MSSLLIVTALLSASAFAYVDWTKSILDGITCIDNFPDLLDADVDAIRAGLETALFTSVDLVKAYIARIQEVNDALHVVNELNPDAETIAAERDAQRTNGAVLGPLHGMPILLKDNIATHDQMNNTAGSYLLVGAKVPRDSTIAAKLREAGAILLGKANLSQWMAFRSANTTSGWSAYGGQVKGAYVEDQEPNGSSSGSAVASSLGLVLAAIGTETMGSLVFPAGVNNVVGIKPSVGLTSRYLIVPNSARQDTVGPIARTVKDAAYVLQSIAGVDERDNYTSAIPNNGAIPDYVAACREDALRGVRIGVPFNIIEGYSEFLEPSLLAAFEQAVKQVEAAGATIVDANLTDAVFRAFQMDQNNSRVLTADFKSGIAKYLSELEHSPMAKNLSDVRAWTRALPSENYPERDTLIWDIAIASNLTSASPEIWQAYQDSYYFGAEGGVLGALERSNTSALLLPTMISAALPAIIGSPIITLPMGAHNNSTTVVKNEWGNLVRIAPNMPFGLAFLGKHWSEKDLIGYAFAYEQRTKHREQIKPIILPKTTLVDITNATTFLVPNETPTDNSTVGTTVIGRGISMHPSVLNTAALSAIVAAIVFEGLRPL